MTDDRSLERAARSFIEPGPTRAPEAAVVRALLLIETTPQERDLRIPLRFRTMTTPARVAAAAVVGVLAIGGASFILGRAGQSNVGGPSPSAPQPSPSAPHSSPPSSAIGAASPASSAAPVDYSSVKGTILIEHLGNAPDLSEMPTTDYHPERRRLYFMDPAKMTGTTAREFLPSQPPSGKLNADVSPDGKQVVFMDTADPAVVWIANLDGTGLRKLSTACGCSELDPAFDPTGTKIAFVHLEGAWRLSQNGAQMRIEVRSGPSISWLGIRDLATGKVTKLVQTVGPSSDAVPEQPSWSPDGKKIVFNRTTWGSGDVPDHGVLQIVDEASGKVTSLSNLTKLPGDADWSPDGARILYTDYPWSSMGSIGGLPDPELVTIQPDGTDLVGLTGAAGATWMPDGRILFQSGRPDGGGFFWIMNADGSAARPINIRGDSLTDLPQGFAYISHWIAAAP
jgi:Tol biopolymer transport system component